MPYIQRSAPTLNTLEDVRAWVEDELGYIEQAQHDTLVLELKPSFVDMDKPREGMIVYADGTHFNPGGGAGSYEYRGGTWHKLAEDIDLSEIETDITDLENEVAANTAAIAGPTAISGFTNGSDAAAGKIGEYKSSFVLVGSAVSISGDTQITSLTLPAGDWDLWGEIFLSPFSATITDCFAAINTTVNTSVTIPADGVDFEAIRSVSTTSVVTVNGLRTRVSITSPTTYFLVINVLFSGTAVDGYGALRARRMR